MFWKRKTKATNNALTAQRSKIKQQDDEILILQTTIREMDQAIYNMSQCSSWTQMQPIFADLLYDTNLRMKEESERIQKVLLPEMRKAYR
jgi:hypothetical protein